MGGDIAWYFISRTGIPPSKAVNSCSISPNQEVDFLTRLTPRNASLNPLSPVSLKRVQRNTI